MASSRKIELSKFQTITDSLYAYIPDNSTKYHLANKLIQKGEYDNILRQKLGLNKDEEINKISFPAYISTIEPTLEDNKISILYASGQIFNGEGEDGIYSETFIQEIKKVANDDNIKAVVLRINSPGGSANASDEILFELTELKKKKPLIVSFGDYAASGGYYIASGASKIIAEPNTLTGSIGIFGMFPNTAGLFNKLALTTDIVKTNRYADFGDPARPMTDDEKALIQGYIERGYDTFLTRCSEGRGVSKADIDSIGQGRVWTGEQALKIGLVDELGGIERAVELAGELAEIYNYNIMEVSTDHDFLKELLEKQIEVVKQSVVKDMLGDEYEHFRTLQKVKATYGIQARIPYDLKPL